MKPIQAFLLALALLIAACCATDCTEPEEASMSSYPLETGEQKGQLSEETLREASARYGGSMEEIAGLRSTLPPGDWISVILGPLLSEQANSPSGSSTDAGLGIREIISQELTRSKGLILVDDSKERFADQFPRPDLANRGIQYVIKGLASTKECCGEVIVFLRAVKTHSGEVAAIASAQAPAWEKAAREAASNLVLKLKRKKP